MKNFSLILFALLLSSNLFSQTTDTLSLGKTGREFFIKGNQKYKASEYKSVFTNQEALAYMKKSRTNNAVSQVFGVMGGGLVGWGLATAISGKKTVQNGMVIKEQAKGGWGLVGAGVGLIGIAIPFAIGSSKNLKNAVKTQNNADRNSTEAENTHASRFYKLEIGGNGVGLSYNF
ncbi:hypothetical protein [Chryseobacterium caseinilyticum]|uniref:Uncharacterized protein n=1 Tax=Chryseobacterium caseinilyticum TaxID=2771428 RepID=A0ABR8ZDC1_9FLAO|nr:hypothetical protein [Chryseobacterium caseinilyticum]MBD8083304.1 hypothetical protein [Chryseobacterium caseinilyticum]